MNKIKPYREDSVVYYADTCLPLIDAYERKKIDFKALARYTYPGIRLGEDTIGLNSIGYWYAKEPQDWGLGWHRNEGIEFHFLESGSMPYAQDGKEVLLTPNNLTITRPWERHRVGNPYVGMGKFYWMIIDVGVRRPHEEWVWPDWIALTKKDLFRLTTILRQNEKSTWRTDDRVCECFKKIKEAIDDYEDENNASKVRVFINYLFVLILEILEEDDVVLDETLVDSARSVECFLEELEENLSKDWTIEMMSKSAGVGITRFTHHCKKLTNLTPMRFLMIKRLEMAKGVLRTNIEYTVSEVAYMCGFTSSQYFSTVFKKYEKCTPKEYQQKATV